LVGIDQLLSSSSEAPAAKRQCLNHSCIIKDIADIFAADPMDETEDSTDVNKPSQHIVIEGAPGIGKTVLAKEIAYCWANKEILQHVQLILLIFLRDPRLQEIKSVRQLFNFSPLLK